MSRGKRISLFLAALISVALLVSVFGLNAAGEVVTLRVLNYLDATAPGVER
ncbi:MAG: hypothetical protein GX493_00090 [Firmicutes bacterium]|nr:hypothetical protein [Bacillota bacterium]